MPTARTQRSWMVAGALSLAQIVAASGAGADPFAYAWQELAPGVWAGIRQDPFELPQEGNSLFVVTEQGVVVFDAGGSPAMGESIVAKVRSVTAHPITHVVLSHWHGDHMRGLQAIRAAFPAAQIVAHAHTRERIVATQDKWLERRVRMVPHIRQMVADALRNRQDLSGRPLIAEERAWLEAGLGNADRLDVENNRTTYVSPDLTFDDHLTLYAGSREIQLFHPGNAHTAGDVILWLPQERIVATGDVVTAPIPLMPSAYTADYGAVLERIEGLGFASLVPGHGPVEHDNAYLELLGETMRSVSAQMQSLVVQGVAESEAVGRIDFSRVEERFVHGDAFLAHRFQDYVASPLPRAAYLAAIGKNPEEAF